jgi:hypothetical protein
MAKRSSVGDFPFGANAPKAKQPKKPKFKQTSDTKRFFAMARRRGGELHGRSGS